MVTRLSRKFRLFAVLALILSFVLPQAAVLAEEPPVPGTNSFVGDGSTQTHDATMTDDVTSTSVIADPLRRFTGLSVQGGYVAAGTAMRNSGYGTIEITGIPARSRIVAAYLYWDVLANSASDSLARGEFARDLGVDFHWFPILGNPLAVPIQGTLIGTGGDPCWGNMHNFAYRANVTRMVSGNGRYQLSGFASGITDGRDPWIQGSQAPMLEGASLIVIYSNPSSQPTQVMIYEGSDLVMGSSTQTIDGFDAAGVSQARTTFIGADGQSAGEQDSLFNEHALPEVRWDGNDPQSGPNFSQGNLWDTMTVDVTDFVPPESTSATVTVGGGSDCLVWVAQVLSISGSSAPTVDTLKPGGTWITPNQNASPHNGRFHLAAHAYDNEGGSGVAKVIFTAFYSGRWHTIGDVSKPNPGTDVYESWWNIPKDIPDGRLIVSFDVYDKAELENLKKAPNGIRVVNTRGTIAEEPVRYKFPWDKHQKFIEFRAAPHRWGGAGERSGIDFGTAQQHRQAGNPTPVLAMQSGTVMEVRSEEFERERGPSNYTCALNKQALPCNNVRILDDRGYEVQYLHLARILPGLGTGDLRHIEQGQVIGWEGDSGAPGRIHMHLEFIGVDGKHSAHPSLEGVVIDGWTIHVNCNGIEQLTHIGNGTCDRDDEHYATGYMSRGKEYILAEGDLPIGDQSFYPLESRNDCKPEGCSEMPS